MTSPSESGPESQPERHSATTTEQSSTTIRAWLLGALTNEWAGSDPQITIDRDEILIVLEVAAPEMAGDADEVTRAAAVDGRIVGYRGDTRERRIEVATQAEHKFGRKVSWGVRVGGTTQLFTHLTVPTMTRLRQPERKVLDTLVAAGVARSRSDALAWCVRLVGTNAHTWLEDLQSAMESVDRIREQGPQSATPG
jgi:hypothetical protein